MHFHDVYNTSDSTESKKKKNHFQQASEKYCFIINQYICNIIVMSAEVQRTYRPNNK